MRWIEISENLEKFLPTGLVFLALAMYTLCVGYEGYVRKGKTMKEIDDFVAAADEVAAEHWKRSGYTHSPPPRHRADYISDRWARVVTLESRNGEYVAGSVYAFIALADNETKSLGKVVAGDIHKAASYKAPAKRARGNVFSPDFRKALTPYGVVYLR